LREFSGNVLFFGPEDYYTLGYEDWIDDEDLNPYHYRVKINPSAPYRPTRSSYDMGEREKGSSWTDAAKIVQLECEKSRERQRN